MNTNTTSRRIFVSENSGEEQPSARGFLDEVAVPVIPTEAAEAAEEQDESEPIKKVIQLIFFS